MTALIFYVQQYLLKQCMMHFINSLSQENKKIFMHLYVCMSLEDSYHLIWMLMGKNINSEDVVNIRLS